MDGLIVAKTSKQMPIVKDGLWFAMSQSLVVEMDGDDCHEEHSK